MSNLCEFQYSLLSNEPSLQGFLYSDSLSIVIVLMFDEFEYFYKKFHH